MKLSCRHYEYFILFLRSARVRSIVLQLPVASETHRIPKEMPLIFVDSVQLQQVQSSNLEHLYCSYMSTGLYQPRVKKTNI